MWSLSERKRYEYNGHAGTQVDHISATDVEGIFRLSGSAKRIKELQAIFDSPERYGKGLDWTGYTVHDAANILRRYLNQLPQPIVPLDFYEKFRDPLRGHQTQAVGDMEAQAQSVGDFDHDKAIVTYQRLITELPPLNRQLMLYILDLLAVFASKSDINLMTSANLAAIFQPGLLSHPTHDMSPQDYRLSQDVVIFLVDNQDSFLIGMSGTAADEKTVREVQSGAPARQPNTPTKATQAGLGRSTSNASAGADSLRKLGVRRNLSVSSKNSKHSSTGGPTTPSSGAFGSGGSGVYRSNTVPSKKSPGLASTRFVRGVESPNTPLALSPALQTPSARSASPAKAVLNTNEAQNTLAPQAAPPADQSFVSQPSTPAPNTRDESKAQSLTSENASLQTGTSESAQLLGPPSKSRKVSGLLAKPTSVEKEPRQPNKLKKKRMPSGTHPSANSSTHSLQDSPKSAAFYTPLVTPGIGAQAQADPLGAALAPILSNTAVTPQPETTPVAGKLTHEEARPPALDPSHQASESTLKAKSPAGSIRSKSSVTDLSELDHNDESKAERKEKKHRWRFSHSAKKNGQPVALGSAPPAQVGSSAVAETSTSSIGSWHKSRKSTSNDPTSSDNEPVPALPAQHLHANDDTAHSKEREDSQEGEKKGFFGKMRARVTHAREERKERGKSPPADTERSGSKQSLSAIAQDALPHRGRSMDLGTEQVPESELQPPPKPSASGS